MPLSTKEPPHLAEHKTLIKGTESRLFVLASAGLTMLMAGLCFKTVRRSITAHYANRRAGALHSAQPMAAVFCSAASAIAQLKS
jgi:hypothetical protein